MPEETKDIDGGAAAKEAGAAGTKPGGAANQAKGFAPRAPKFEGKCADLKGASTTARTSANPTSTPRRQWRWQSM